MNNTNTNKAMENFHTAVAALHDSIAGLSIFTEAVNVKVDEPIIGKPLLHPYSYGRKYQQLLSVLSDKDFLELRSARRKIRYFNMYLGEQFGAFQREMERRGYVDESDDNTLKTLI